MSPAVRTALRSIVLGGFIAGTIDIGAACLINWLTPRIILQSIASGLLGKASFHEGLSSAALGLVLQWLMSLIIAACFVIAAQRLPSLTKKWLPAGAAYGVVIFFVMNYIVMPLSAVRHHAHFTVQTFIENMLAMILFGLIVAFFARDPAARITHR
jgi:uncharacterized membrane protein YagU involved in acid resistance